MAITCPQCGAVDQHIKLRHKQLLTLGHYILAIITGTIGILIWHFSLESKFQCGKCSQIFFMRTPVARVFRVIFHIFIGAFFIAGLVAVYILVFDNKP